MQVHYVSHACVRVFISKRLLFYGACQQIRFLMLLFNPVIINNGVYVLVIYNNRSNWEMCIWIIEM